MSPRRYRPHGHPTRGKTALNRLRQVDIYILLAWSSVLSGHSPLIIDLGYGAYPWTALEMLARWRTFNPTLRLLGVEIDPERVAAALPFAEPGQIEFKIGGFNLSNLLNGEQAQVIRAYNVLRQYEEAAVEDALQLMAQALAPGGILIEGTSTPTGGLVAFDVYQKIGNQLEHLELVLGTNFSDLPIEITHFQAILPKRLIHHMQDEKPAAFFSLWRQALTIARSQSIVDPRQQWIEAALRLSQQYRIDTRQRILRRGFLAIREML